MIDRPNTDLLDAGSWVPLWLSTFVGAVIYAAAIITAAWVGDARPVTALAAVQPFALAIWIYVAVSRRTTRLVQLTQRVDPEDLGPAELAELRQLACGPAACTEIDHVQLALLELVVHARTFAAPAVVGGGSPTQPHATRGAIVNYADDEGLVLRTARGPGTARGLPPSARGGPADRPRSGRGDGFWSARSGPNTSRSAADTAGSGGRDDGFESCVGSYNSPTPPSFAGGGNGTGNGHNQPSAAGEEREMAWTPPRRRKSLAEGADDDPQSALVPAAARPPPPRDPRAADPNGDDALPWSEAMRGARDPGGPIFFQLMKQLRIGQSLSAVTLPVSILEARSLLEKFSDQFVHADLLREHDAESDPYERLLVVVRWWLAAYHIKPDGAKKPYNPVLGEVFCCRFPDAAYIAEQVCHHPPVTAIRAAGPSFTLQAVYHPQSKLVSPNSAASIGQGEGWIEVGQRRERYTLSWPSVYVSGFLAGSARIELGGKVRISAASTKVSAEIEFQRKGMFGGHHDQVVVHLHSPDGSRSGTRVKGCWHAALERIDFDDPPRPWLDAGRLPMPRPATQDIASHPLQSRAVWAELTRAIRAGDGDRAAAAKHKVEEAQRAVRKELAAAGRVHETRFFKFHTGDEGLALNAKGHTGSGDREALWRVANWTYVGHDKGVPVA